MENNNSVCVLNINIFKKYWNYLLLNYNKPHTQNLFNLYYSFFKDCSERDFILAVKKCIEKEKYFPNISELFKYLPSEDTDKLNEWKNVKKEEVSEEEKKELEEMFKDFR